MYHTYIDGDMKYLRSSNYNYNFNLKTGYFARWGKFESEDPEWCEFGPEIADIEISTKCHGINHGNPGGSSCKFCYKSNNPKDSINMSLDTYIQILDTMPLTLTQVAFGIGDIDANPDLFPIMKYTRDNNIIPNITINGDRMKESDYDNLASLAGAVSVSYYNDKDICFNAIEKLNQKGMKQVNIHVLLSQETLSWCYDVIEASKNDKRLLGLNAIVFLAVKQKGRGVNYNPVNDSDYKQLIETCLEKEIRFGFDSCGANKFSKVATEIGREDLNIYSEPCESGCFSSFISAEGKYYPCSFATESFDGIDCTKIENFTDEVWMNHGVCGERQKLICNGRNCPYFNV